MNTYQQQIDEYIEANKDQLVRHIQEVVKIESVIGNEKKMQEYMERIYEEIGLEVKEVIPDYRKLTAHEAFVDSGISFENRKNIIGLYKGKGDGKSLTLHGHVDVVSPNPLEKWTKSPWDGEIEGTKLYGRGSADMKAGLISNWFALKTLVDLGIQLQGTVQLHSVIEEEAGGGGGALACLEDGYVTDGFISTEPHNLNVTVAHAGIMYFRVKVVGKTAHAGLAHEGVNAIGKMYKIYHALEELGRKRAKEIQFDLFNKGSGQSVHLNPGTLHAGDWVSNVAGHAVLECRIGFIPGEDRNSIKKLIYETIARVANEDEWLKENVPKIEWFGWSTEPWYQDPKHEFVASFLQTASTILGEKVEIIGRASGNDARFTQYYNKPGICFGPTGGNIHGPDEFVELDSVVKVTKVLANYIIEWTSLHNTVNRKQEQYESTSS
ncbi:ArgE/DapE family deacylase [Bacillus massiliigorillae]|uniref:ArgE/DapE family deacylase n=1 Tax=Bacillus massiliigorillae TaxID=1243664 RepID=UPI0003A7CCED|nr:ArgE/DapE family deacylase [Bacillus massiliigorillae]